MIAFLVFSGREDLWLPRNFAHGIGSKSAPERVANCHANLRARNRVECLVAGLGDVEFHGGLRLTLGLSLDHPSFLDRDQVVAFLLLDTDHGKGWQTGVAR